MMSFLWEGQQLSAGSPSLAVVGVYILLEHARVQLPFGETMAKHRQRAERWAVWVSLLLPRLHCQDFFCHFPRTLGTSWGRFRLPGSWEQELGSLRSRSAETRRGNHSSIQRKQQGSNPGSREGKGQTWGAEVKSGICTGDWSQLSLHCQKTIYVPTTKLSERPPVALEWKQEAKASGELRDHAA